MKNRESKEWIVFVVVWLLICLAFAILAPRPVRAQSATPDGEPITESGIDLLVVAPSTNASNNTCTPVLTDSGLVFVPGTPLMDLKEILIRGRRFTDRRDSLFLTIPAVGMEGDTIPFRFLAPPGSMGWIASWARDHSGNESCRGAEYVWTIPAVDAPEPAPPPEGSGLADYFSVWWYGSVIALTSGSYTFATSSDDGIRLWIDGVKVQDRSTKGESTNTINLAAGAHAISLEFSEGWGAARVTLSWSGPGFTLRPIPREALRQ